MISAVKTLGVRVAGLTSPPGITILLFHNANAVVTGAQILSLGFSAAECNVP